MMTTVIASSRKRKKEERQRDRAVADYVKKTLGAGQPVKRSAIEELIAP